MSQVIVAYCQRVAVATGRSLCVIDRAVHAVAMAGAFDDQGVGVLCMLDDNEHAGLERFAATEVDLLADGTRVYRGPWKEPRPDEPRHVVIVVPPEDKTLVYWGTPKVENALETTEWPRVYRERNAMQAHRFKRWLSQANNMAIRGLTRLGVRPLTRTFQNSFSRGPRRLWGFTTQSGGM